MSTNFIFFMIISIHSLVKRETLLFLPLFLDISHFNPLSRKEGDAGHSLQLHRTLSISIHSLVKRETSESALSVASWINFNPLPRKEGDHRYDSAWKMD